MKKFLLSFLSLFLIASMAHADVEWQLVTDDSTLQAGDRLIITNADGTVAMSNADNTNNRKVVSITKQNNVIYPGDDVLIVELGGEKDAWTFKTVNYLGTNGYFASATSGSNNHLKVVTSPMTATITFTNGVPLINFDPGVASFTRTMLKYNSSSQIFACYSTAQSPIAIYKSVEVAPDTREEVELSWSESEVSAELGGVIS